MMKPERRPEDERGWSATYYLAIVAITISRAVTKICKACTQAFLRVAIPSGTELADAGLSEDQYLKIMITGFGIGACPMSRVSLYLILEETNTIAQADTVVTLRKGDNEGSVQSDG